MLIQDALEELCYEGEKGCEFQFLVSALCLRDPKKVIYTEQKYQLRLLKELLNHAEISSKVSRAKLGELEAEIDELLEDDKEEIVVEECVTPSKRKNSPEGRGGKKSAKIVAEEEIVFTGEECLLDKRFRNLHLRASTELIVNVLNLSIYPEIVNNPIRLRMYLEIARKRYSGYWQYALGKALGMEPKSVFQHLKPFYRYELIVRLSLILPQGLRQGDKSQLSSSGVIWLSRFFDVSKMPPHLLQVFATQQITPFRQSCIQLLKDQPNHTLLERDVRAFFLSFFLNSSDRHGTFLCSPKTASRFYLRMRRELLIEKAISRIRAWCPQTARVELCITLGKNCENVAATPTVKTQQHDSELDDEDDDTDAPLTEGLGVEGLHVETMDMSRATKYVQPQLANGEENENDDNDNDNDADDEVDLTSPFRQLSVAQQALALIRATKHIGIVTPEIATALGSTTKRLTKVLSNLEASNLITKKAQRQGKFFMYRYFATGFQTKLELTAIRCPQFDTSIGYQDGRAAARKTMTEQFVRRLDCFVKWVRERRACMIPDIARSFAEDEQTPNGPDRKTIMRIAAVALKQPHGDWLKTGKLCLGVKRSQSVLFFYDATQFEDEEEAQDFVRRALSEKRSEACKEALRKNSELTAALRDKHDENSRQMLNHLEEINEKIKSWEAGSNPIMKYTSENTITRVLPSVMVEPKLDEIVRRVAAKYDQRLLAHYGFIFPVIIRLKVFHTHLMNLLDVHCPDRNSADPAHLPTSVILDEMTLDNFLRLVGYGYRDDFIEAYLHGDTLRCNGTAVAANGELLMKNLPEDVYYRLVTAGRQASMRSPTRRNAYLAIHRLMNKLSFLGLVNRTPITEQQAQETDEIDVAASVEALRFFTSTNAKVARKMVAHRAVDSIHAMAETTRWTLPNNVALYQLVEEGVGEQIGDFFAVREERDRENFWSALKAQVERWMRRFTSEMKHVHSGRGFSRTRRHTVSRSVTQLPTNLQFPEVFAKKNWKAQLVFGASVRTELDRLVKMIVQKGGDDQLCILNPQSEDIIQFARRLMLTPDAVVKYLVRYFSTTENAKMLSLVRGRSGVALHTSRDLRYRCHLCGVMYSQLPSMTGHYRGVHGVMLPEDSSVYVLPMELDRRKRRARKQDHRRKRRRKNDMDLSSRDNTPDEHLMALVNTFNDCEVDEDETTHDWRREKIAANKEGRVEIPWWYGLPPRGHERYAKSGLSSTELRRVAVLAVNPEADVPSTALTPVPDHQRSFMEDEPSTSPTEQLAAGANGLTPEGDIALKWLRLSEAERRQLRKFFAEARRDDEYLLIGFVVVAERMCAAELVGDGGETRLKEALKRGVNKDGLSGAATEVLPAVNDRVWELFAALHHTRTFAPASAYFIAQYCLYRYASTLNQRLLATYRRLTGEELHHALLTFGLPLKTATPRYCLGEMPTLSVSKETDWSSISIMGQEGEEAWSLAQVVGSSVFKPLLFTPPSRYRPGWACNAVRDAMTEHEAARLWQHWNLAGFVVLSKRALPSEHVFPFTQMIYWDAKCRRRFQLGRGVQSMMFGRHRHWQSSHWACKHREILAANMEVTEREGRWRELHSAGLSASAAMCVVEAVANKQVDLSFTWTPNTDENLIFPVRDDDYCIQDVDQTEVPEPSSWRKNLREAVASALSARGTVGLSTFEDDRAEGDRAEGTDDSSEGAMSPSLSPKTDDGEPATEDDEEEDEFEDELLDSESEDADDEDADEDDDDGLMRRSGALGGIHTHIAKLTPGVPCMGSLYWQPAASKETRAAKETEAETPAAARVTRSRRKIEKAEGEIACVGKQEKREQQSRIASEQVGGPQGLQLLYEQTSFHPCLAGVPVDIEIHPSTGRFSSGFEIAAIDPCFLPANVCDLAAFSDPKALEENFNQEKRLVYEEEDDGWLTCASRVDAGIVALTYTPSADIVQVSAVDFLQKLRLLAAEQDPVTQDQVAVCEENGDDVNSLSKTTDAIMTGAFRLRRIVLEQGSCGIFKIDALQLWKQESVCNHGDTGDCECCECSEQLFDQSLSVLIAIRAIVQIPTTADWRLLSPSAALRYSLPLRQIVSPNPISRPEAKRETRASARQSRALARETRQHTETEQEPPTLLNHNITFESRFSDPISCPYFIPQSLWRIWGPAPGTLNEYACDMREEVEQTGAEKAYVRRRLQEDNERAVLLDVLQKMFVCLLSASTEPTRTCMDSPSNHVKNRGRATTPRTTSPRTTSPGHVSSGHVSPRRVSPHRSVSPQRSVSPGKSSSTESDLTPESDEISCEFLAADRQASGTFMRMDGRLNTSFLAMFISRVYVLLSEEPGQRLSALVRKLPLCERCELKLILDGMEAGGLISSRLVPLHTIFEKDAAERRESGQCLLVHEEIALEATNPNVTHIRLYAPK